MSSPYLTILDVGHGNSAILRYGTKVLVIDTGAGISLLEYLQAEGIGRIDLLLLSHADQDHIAGLVALLSAGTFEIGKVYVNSDAEKDSKLWDDLVYEMSQADRAGKLDFRTGLTTKHNPELVFDDLQLEVLSPGTYLATKGAGSTYRDGRKITTNTISAVIRLIYKGSSVVLFTADMDDITLDDILAVPLDISAQVLVFPHHGCRFGKGHIASYVGKLCGRVNPQSVVFSNGRGKHEAARQDIMLSVRAVLPTARLMCTQLSTHCSADLPVSRPAYLEDIFSSGKESRRCCAGSIRINLDSLSFLTPPAEAHRLFVLSNAPTALCGVK